LSPVRVSLAKMFIRASNAYGRNRAMKIREARAGDERPLAEMRSLLWPTTTFDEQLTEMREFLAGKIPGTLPCTSFIAEDDSGTPIGFIEVDLRSHVDGCDTHQPTGYIEGWFVHEASRGQGIGKALVNAAEDWSRAHGCKEMGSDALIDNEISIQAHAALGFEVVDRCVNFRKDL